MAKIKVKVIQVTSTADGLHRVVAGNSADAFGFEFESLDGKKITEAQAKKLKPNEYRRMRVQLADLISFNLSTKTEYKVGQKISLSY